MGGYAGADGLVDGGGDGDDGNPVMPADLRLVEVLVVHLVELAALPAGPVPVGHGEMNLGRVDVGQVVELQSGVMAEHSPSAGPERGQHVRIELADRKLLEPVYPVCHPSKLLAVGELSQLDHVDSQPPSVLGGDVAVLIERHLPQFRLDPSCHRTASCEGQDFTTSGKVLASISLIRVDGGQKLRR